MVATGAPLAFPLAASCGLTAATLVAAGRLSRNGRRTRRVVILLESMWLAGAAIDVGLSVALAHRGLELVPSLTRIVIPVGIIVLLTRPPVRAASRRGGAMILHAESPISRGFGDYAISPMYLVVEEHGIALILAALVPLGFWTASLWAARRDGSTRRLYSAYNSRPAGHQLAAWMVASLGGHSPRPGTRARDERLERRLSGGSGGLAVRPGPPHRTPPTIPDLRDDGPGGIGTRLCRLRI